MNGYDTGCFDHSSKIMGEKLFDKGPKIIPGRQLSEAVNDCFKVTNY
jgi:hypothetical protein